MSHTPGPYVLAPSRFAGGFLIVEAREPAALPIALVPRNGRGTETVEANATLFAAAPLMLMALQAIALDKSIDFDLQLLVEHVVRAATIITPTATAATPGEDHVQKD